MVMAFTLLICAMASISTGAFSVNNANRPAMMRRVVMMSEDKGLFDSVEVGVRKFQESQAAGLGFKQSIADALAGDYDQAQVKSKLESLVSSAPCVVFTWERSPFSHKALKALEVAGVEFTEVGLDKPWSDGNPLRAELGRLTGQTSVPSVWIGGEYVGGFDGGPSPDAPGIVDMAFAGTLRPKLEEAGALK